MPAPAKARALADVQVLVEGNYLLLWDAAPWRELADLFDRTW